MNEVKWAELKRYPGYTVSSTGEVKDPSGELVLQKLTRDGYMEVKLGDGVWELRSQYVHRLVLEAFWGPAGDWWTCHKNDVPDDNRLTNLEYGTSKLNGEQASANRKAGKKSAKTCLARRLIPGLISSIGHPIRKFEYYWKDCPCRVGCDCGKCDGAGRNLPNKRFCG